MISLGIAVAIRVLEIVPHTLFSSISRIHARFGVDAYLFCIGSHNYCIMTPLIPRWHHVPTFWIPLSQFWCEKGVPMAWMARLWLTMHFGFSFGVSPL